jgi:hypothetical protein
MDWCDDPAVTAPSPDKLSPLVLATQPKLLSVNLTNNLISSVQSGAFANMTRLVRLILTKNKIAGLEDGSLQGITCPRHSFLGSCSTSHQPTKQFHSRPGQPGRAGPVE